MKKELINRLYKNRLLRNKKEFKEFEDSLKEASEAIQENDILELCNVFDDNTMDDEVMFGLIHLIEMFSSEKAFELTVLGLSRMVKTSPNWAKIIIYRCLNDSLPRKMLKNSINCADVQTKQIIIKLLNIIKQEDGIKFGTFIDEVLN